MSCPQEVISVLAHMVLLLGAKAFFLEGEGGGLYLSTVLEQVVATVTSQEIVDTLLARPPHHLPFVEK